jgi:hypothetical protein
VKTPAANCTSQDPDEARAIAELEQLQREVRQSFHPPGTNLDLVDRLHKRVKLGATEWARRYSHPGRGRRGRRQSTASRLAISAAMKRVVQSKRRDSHGRFAR